jgi:hypothetical protein
VEKQRVPLTLTLAVIGFCTLLQKMAGVRMLCRFRLRQSRSFQ